MRFLVLYLKLSLEVWVRFFVFVVSRGYVEEDIYVTFAPSNFITFKFCCDLFVFLLNTLFFGGLFYNLFE
jgi:hypothetical protein